MATHEQTASWSALESEAHREEVEEIIRGKIGPELLVRPGVPR
jgi:hypothetical protein